MGSAWSGNGNSSGPDPSEMPAFLPDMGLPRRRRRRGPPPKLYRIGEVVRYSGVSRQTIHNYTTMGLLREQDWTPGGHRLYGEGVFERLEQITLMKAKRKSLRLIREHFAALDEVGAPGPGQGPEPPRDEDGRMQISLG